jgi:tetratricopeptide (TPR) repeat protein
LNTEQYYNLATLRIVSAFFYLKDRPALTNEVNGFLAANSTVRVPAEILEWLGVEYYNEKDYKAAAKYFSVLGQSESLANVKPDFWFYLGDTETKLNNFAQAEAAYEKYLQLATDPAAKAKTLLALGATKIGAHKPDDAQKIAEEIMRLQPEGRVNAEARLLASISTKRARLSWGSPCFMTTPRLLLALCKKRPWRMKRPVKKKKRIASQDSSAISIPTTSAADCSLAQRQKSSES